MANPLNLLGLFSQFCNTKAKLFSPHRSIFFLLTLSLTVTSANPAQAETAETAPPALKEALSQIDAAANRRDASGVMQFYGNNFKNGDGLNRSAMEEVLKKFWEHYPQLNYRTELQSWQNEGNAIVAETITYITGSESSNGMTGKLESTLRSRQRYEGQKIVYSEILAEASQLTSGSNPPTVQVNLPAQVSVNQAFAFDAIVKEPLGDGMLLGTAIEEPITPERYSQPSDFELELLPGGGLFKEGKAPVIKENRWISAVLIRANGMTTITRRLLVVDGGRGSRSSSQ
jgi:hypothetical protein